MPIHKLADGPITITVVGVESVEGKFGQQVRFSGEDGTDVYVNELPAQKQLARLQLDAQAVVGKTIHLEQVKKNGTTFTNISLAAGASAGAAAPRAAAAVPAAAPKLSVEELGVLYGQCVALAFEHLYRQCEEAGLAVTSEAIQAAAATLFIKATR